MADEAKRAGLIDAIKGLFGPSADQPKPTEPGKPSEGAEAAMGCQQTHTDRTGKQITCEEWRRQNPDHE